MIKTEINDEQVLLALSKLGQQLTDMTEVFQVLGEALEDSTERRFDEGVSPEGIPWAPKSPATIAAYEARGYTVNFKPLFGPNLDGRPLRQSFFRQVTATELEIGTNKVQAAVMQFGAAKGAFGTDAKGNSVPWGNIPARPFLGISTEDRDMITLTVEEWLDPDAQD